MLSALVCTHSSLTPNQTFRQFLFLTICKKEHPVVSDSCILPFPESTLSFSAVCEPVALKLIHLFGRCLWRYLWDVVQCVDVDLMEISFKKFTCSGFCFFFFLNQVLFLPRERKEVKSLRILHIFKSVAKNNLAYSYIYRYVDMWPFSIPLDVVVLCECLVFETVSYCRPRWLGTHCVA